MKTTTPWIAEVAKISFQNGVSAEKVAGRIIKKGQTNRDSNAWWQSVLAEQEAYSNPLL
jgi:hypothetical protein